jgi:hypothetical protein
MNKELSVINNYLSSQMISILNLNLYFFNGKLLEESLDLISFKNNKVRYGKLSDIVLMMHELN